MVSRRNFFGKALGVGAAALGYLSLKPKSASAAQRPESLLYKVLDRGKIIVGTGSGNPPWHFEDEKGELQGFISCFRAAILSARRWLLSSAGS